MGDPLQIAMETSYVLVGFHEYDDPLLNKLIQDAGWNIDLVDLDKGSTLVSRLSGIDVVVIDSDKAPTYPPELVAELRDLNGTSHQPLVVVVSSLLLPAFREQLTKAGADLFLNKPRSLEDCFPMFVEAVSERLCCKAA